MRFNTRPVQSHPEQLIQICIEREERKQEREREREEREREERERADAAKLVWIKENAETDRIRIKHIGTFSSTTVK